MDGHQQLIWEGLCTSQRTRGWTTVKHWNNCQHTTLVATVKLTEDLMHQTVLTRRSIEFLAATSNETHTVRVAGCAKAESATLAQRT